MPRCVQMISDVSLSANNSTLVAYLLDAASLVRAYVLFHSGTVTCKSCSKPTTDRLQ